MKLENFIEMLKEYPMDAEVQLYEKYGYDKNIFKIAMREDKVFLIPLHSALEEISNNDVEYEKVSYNMDDTFSTYSHQTGDTVTGKYGDFKVMVEAQEDRYEDEFSYKNNDFRFVGGLVKFLSAFPDDMPVNLVSSEAHHGVIHEIHKRTIEYFTGVDPRDGDVISDFSDELFFEFGVPVSGWCGGGSFPLRDNYPWASSDEIPKVIAEPIKKYFDDNGIVLSDEESKLWGDVVLAIKSNLYKYYSFTRRLNGSWDSNGSFHPCDNDEVYVKPDF